MAKFPIRYAEKEPPAVGPSVRGQLDVRTGGVEAGEQLARAGGRLAAFASKIKEAEDVVGYAQTRLKVDGLRDAYLSALQTTTDPEAIAALQTKAEADMTEAASTEREQVYSLSQISNIRGATIQITTTRRAKDAEIAGKTALQAFLEKGDREGYGETIAGLVESGAMLPAEAVIGLQHFETNSVLAQVDNQLASDDPAEWQDARDKLEGLPVEDMTEEQLADRKRWLSAVEQKRKASSNAAVIGIIDTLDKNRELPQEERIPLGKELKTQILGAGLSPEATWIFTERINDWMEGKDTESNPAVWSDLFGAARGLHINSTPEDVAGVRQRLIDATSTGQLSWTDAKYLRQMLEDLVGEAEAYNVNYAVEQGERHGKDPVVLHRALISEMRAKKIPLDKIIETSARLEATLPDMPPKDTFERRWIEQTLGVLESDRYRKSGEAIDYVLSRLGPDWATVSPRAVEIFKKKWPVYFWHYRSDEEKAALLDRTRKLETSWLWTDGHVITPGEDITEGDRELAVQAAPSGPLTPEQVQKFENLLEQEGKILPKPPEPAAGAVAPQVGPESLEGWEDLAAEQQAELKLRWEQSR
ncbi:MAG TPA: hypothetical protein VMY37_37900 [Thermoguttaceae bacterium]|nr:hypothetical protein [Thermoguttaceae bacterium]